MSMKLAEARYLLDTMQGAYYPETRSDAMEELVVALVEKYMLPDLAREEGVIIHETTEER